MPDFMGMAGPYSLLEHLNGNVSDAGSLVSREVIDAGVRFDPAFRLGLEDWDFWLQAAERGFRGHHVSGAGFWYRRRPESMLRSTARHENEVTGHLRRKHSRWATARRHVELEHAEAPRYVFWDPQSDAVALFTYPRDRSRTMPLKAFLEQAALSVAHECFRTLPAFAISGPESAFADTRRIVGHIWHMQRTCEREGCAFAPPLTMLPIEGLVKGEHPERRFPALHAGEVHPTLRMAAMGRRKTSLASSLLPIASPGRRVGILARTLGANMLGGFDPLLAGRATCS